jgi:hypothetical protein
MCISVAKPTLITMGLSKARFERQMMCWRQSVRRCLSTSSIETTLAFRCPPRCLCVVLRRGLLRLSTSALILEPLFYGATPDSGGATDALAGLLRIECDSDK